MPKIITIITPSFNQGKFIDATINSVLSQAGDFFIDYIIMDGGSSDHSIDIIKFHEGLLEKNCDTKTIRNVKFFQSLNSNQFSVKCNGISYRWFSEQDKGQAHALNKGFELSVGDILCWLNADDVYVDSSSINKVFEVFNNDPEVFFIYARGLRINDRGKLIQEEKYVTQFGIEDLEEIDYILQPSSFWRREVYAAIGKLNEFLHYTFDWEYWIRISKKYKLCFFDELISCNRVYVDNKTMRGGWDRTKEIIEFLVKHDSLTLRSLRSYVPHELFYPTDLSYKIFRLVLLPLRYARRFVLRILTKLAHPSI